MTSEEVKSLLHYDPETGRLTWLRREGDSQGIKYFNTRFSGKEAGRMDKYGYRAIIIQGKDYLAHRLAWLYVHGEWPENEIDHINGIRDDNRIQNLRSVTHRVNARNLATPKNNTSGRIGVSWNRRDGKWAARIKNQGRLIYLGYFDSFEDACTAREAAEVEFGFHPNHGRKAPKNRRASEAKE